jgi:L-fucose isomerase-like protein
MSTQLKVKPVLIVGDAWHVFPQTDGQLHVTTEIGASRSEVETLFGQLGEKVGGNAAFLEPALIDNEQDLLKLKKDVFEADAFLVYLSGGMSNESFQRLWELEIPIIAFSGNCTPMMGMYALPIEEREYHPNVTFALDYREIKDQLRLVRVIKQLRNTKMVLLGTHQREAYFWQQVPDPVIARRKLGVEFIPVSCEEFLAEAERVVPEEAAAVAEEWTSQAKEVLEPSQAEVNEAAKMYVAMDSILKDKTAQAISVGCLELMYAFGKAPVCFPLAILRDKGYPAGCEADASATLTMVLMEYLADRPAYMGNFVQADPDKNIVMISHGCSPSKMSGRDQPTIPYSLVHSHSYPPFTRVLEGGAGLTSYVEYDKGQEVTISRIGSNLDRMSAASGKIVDCWDSICDRTTISIQVNDARQFFHNATGNHQVVVYGDYLADLRALCRLLDIKLLEV